LAFSEIEDFPRAVLAHHYPGVPCHGDFTVLRDQPWIVDADVLVGGTPCQAFSVAGLRNSLADERGNLSLEFVRLADAIDTIRSGRGREPAIIVWENVPGVLSVKDNAFGCFLAGLAGDVDPYVPPRGKWTNAGVVAGPQRQVAWRVLDAQFFGLAQRRRRVFVVASARDGFDPAAVLLEFEGVRRDTPPRREKGQVAPTIPSRSTAGGGLGTDFDCDGGVIQQPVVMAHGQANAEIRTDGGTPALTCLHEAPIVAHSLRGEGFDASEDGTGRGTPLVPVAFSYKDSGADAANDLSPTLRALGAYDANGGGQMAVAVSLRGHDGGGTAELGGDIQNALRASQGGGDKPHVLAAINHNQETRHANAAQTGPVEALRSLRDAVGEEAFTVWGFGSLVSLQSPEVLQSALHGCGLRPAAFSRSWLVYCSLSRSQDGSGWLLQSLRETGCAGCPPQGWEPSEQLAGELGAYLSQLSQPGPQAERFMRDLWLAAEGPGLLREALSAVQAMGRSTGREGQPAHAGMAVRRLTATECEFLQGFPRGYTAIPWKKKPADQCPDGPRYKALGNSMAVPCMRWIGGRIANAIA
jgi:site-specific DNA-cytosine methylase